MIESTIPYFESEKFKKNIENAGDFLKKLCHDIATHEIKTTNIEGIDIITNATGVEIIEKIKE